MKEPVTFGTSFYARRVGLVMEPKLVRKTLKKRGAAKIRRPTVIAAAQAVEPALFEVLRVAQLQMAKEEKTMRAKHLRAALKEGELAQLFPGIVVIKHKAQPRKKSKKTNGHAVNGAADSSPDDEESEVESPAVEGEVEQK